MYADNSYNVPDNHQQEQHDDDVNANHIEICPTVNCWICQQLFLSNNALHQHLQSTCWALKQFKDPKKAKSATGLYAKPKKKVIIASTAPTTNDLPKYGFRIWQYTTANVQFNKDRQAKIHNVCLDTGCTITLIDRDFLKEVAPNAVIKKWHQLCLSKVLDPKRTHPSTMPPLIYTSAKTNILLKQSIEKYMWSTASRLKCLLA